MDRMEIRLLGPMQVRRGDGSVVDAGEWRTTKTLDLLRLLALSGGEPVPVVSVIDKLWPDVDEARGRASLRTAASQLRKVVAVDCVERRGGALVLRDVWVDTQAYDALLSDAEASRRSGQHARTVAVVREAEALYVGDIEVSDSSGDWLHEAREHVRRMRCRALLDAAGAAASLCWMRDSLDFAQRAADLDMCEEAARALMRALAGLGEIEKALEVFDSSRRQLADRYGVDLSPQTRALHLQLLRGTAAEDAEVGLVGHDETVDTLVETVSGMLRAEPGFGIVWLVGEPGSGRDSVAEAACRQGGLSMHDMGRDAWQHRPEAGLEATWEIPGTDVVVMPHADSVPSHASKLLHTLARQHGGVLVVPVRCAPSDPVGDVPCAAVEVGPLTTDQLAELTELVLQGRPGSGLLRQLSAVSGGLAGTACRTARAWLNQGRVVWCVDGLELAATPSAEVAVASGTLRRRLRMLSPFTEDLVNVLAVAAVEVDAAQLADIVLSLREGYLASDVEAALGQLVDSGLVVLEGGGYRLRESHARPELLSWMRPQLRQQIHRLVADRVVMPPSLRLGHLIAAGEHRRASVMGVVEIEKARARDDSAAVQELTRVLADLPPSLRPDAGLLVHAAGGVGSWSGRSVAGRPVIAASQQPRSSFLRHAAITARRTHERLFGAAAGVLLGADGDAVAGLLAAF